MFTAIRTRASPRSSRLGYGSLSRDVRGPRLITYMLRPARSETGARSGLALMGLDRVSLLGHALKANHAILHPSAPASTRLPFRRFVSKRVRCRRGWSLGHGYAPWRCAARVCDLFDDDIAAGDVQRLFHAGGQIYSCLTSDEASMRSASCLR